MIACINTCLFLLFVYLLFLLLVFVVLSNDPVTWWCNSGESHMVQDSVGDYIVWLCGSMRHLHGMRMCGCVSGQNIKRTCCRKKPPSLLPFPQEIIDPWRKRHQMQGWQNWQGNESWLERRSSQSTTKVVAHGEQNTFKSLWTWASSSSSNAEYLWLVGLIYCNDQLEAAAKAELQWTGAEWVISAPLVANTTWVFATQAQASVCQNIITRPKLSLVCDL